jgi:hypothetical protein
MLTAAVIAEALSSSSEIAHLRMRVASLEAALARTSSRDSPLRAEAGALFSSLQIASLDAKTGAVKMPDNTTHILMEIGCSDLDTLDEQALQADQSAFLLAFEPLVT